MTREGSLETGTVERSLLIVSTVSTTVKAFLLPYAYHFRELGWRVDLLANGISLGTHFSRHFDNAYDINWSRNPLDLGNVFGTVRRVRELVAANNYDIVHVHTPVASFVTRLALRDRIRPIVIYTAHGFHFHPAGNWLRNRVFETLERIAGRWTDFLVTINRTDEACAKRLRIVESERLFYMPGIGLDLSRYHPAENAPDKPPTFVMIAEFIPRKRHGDVIEALARMQHRNTRLVFVGDGPERPVMEALTKSLGLCDRIEFAGKQDDVRPYIWNACATILPSAQEGLPRSVMESLACGVPVIGSDIRGTRDLLENGGGLLFPVGDVAALTASLDRVVAEPQLAIEMGRRGRETARRYDLNLVIAQHEELYGRALELAAESRRGCRCKRILDVTVSAAALTVFGPLLALVAALIRLMLGSPVFFRQFRPGLNGKLFSMLKFRTMRNTFDAHGQPLPDGERLTALGRFLRATSLDELPELWNVLKGDMSLVGPRPLLPQYLPRYNNHQRRRHEVRPGITGWAQVSGRNALSWEERLDLDVWYVDHRSFWLDLKILARTVLTVLLHDGIAPEGHATMPEFMGSADSVSPGF